MMIFFIKYRLLYVSFPAGDVRVLRRKVGLRTGWRDGFVFVSGCCFDAVFLSCGVCSCGEEERSWSGFLGDVVVSIGR